MRRNLRSRLTYANVMASLAMFVALGGTGYAAATIRAQDIQNGAVRSQHILDRGVRSVDLAPSARDRCPGGETVRLGPVCATVPPLVKATNFDGAVDRCAARGLRLPTFSESAALARRYDVPGVGAGSYFWTDNRYDNSVFVAAYIQNEAGDSRYIDTTGGSQLAVCVTTPSN